jgi:hypothetical protein
MYTFGYEVIEKGHAFDLRRNINMAITGTLYMGPCLHYWYTHSVPAILRIIFSNHSKDNKFVRAATGMAFDQLLFAPIVLSGFFVFLNLVKEPKPSGFSTGITQTKEKLWETLVTNWKIWPFATLTNFYFVPINFQVLFANFVGLFWNMYLSYVGAK